MKKPLSLVILFLALTARAAYSASTEIVPTPLAPGLSEVEYGDLYVIQKKEIPKQNWQLVAGYAYGFSNPYLNIHGAQLQLTRRVWDFIHLGIHSAFFGTTEKDLASKLSTQLGAQGINTLVYRPFYSAQGTLVLVPISGMVNLLSLTAVEFDLPIVIGVGATRYREKDSLVPTYRVGIAPQAMFSPYFGVQLGVQTSFEHFGGGEWQNRFETFLGLVGRI